MRTYFYSLCLLTLFSLVCWCDSGRQNGVGWMMAAYRVRKSYEFMEGQTLPKLQNLLEILDLGNDTSLREKDSYTSSQGAVVLRLEEFHNNRVVKGSQIDVSIKADGSIERVGGMVTTGLSEELRKHIRQNCKLSKKGSKRIARQYEGHEKDQITIERVSIAKDLVVTDDGSAYVTVTADITWVDPISDSGNVTRKIYTIDACSKKVLDVELHQADVFDADSQHEKPKKDLSSTKLNDDAIITNNSNSKGVLEKRIPCENPASGFGGNLKTGLIQYGSRPYCLELIFDNDTCFLQNDYVKVVDMHNNASSNPDRVVNFRCQDGYNDTINGGYSVALDTFFHATQTIKMYNEWYGFQPLPDTRALVHFDRHVDNAYWDGRTLIVGDGGRTDTYPFSTLDTVAHEISHGVTEHRSGLHYSGESGAINEAFSDMAGEAVEVFVRGTNDWVVGADVIKEDGHAIRYFDDPTLDGISIGHIKDFHPDMDVHRSSGIFNKAFYIAAQKIGIRDAFRAFVLANRLYWREKSTFEEAACDVIKASYDAGLPMEAFVDAFKAVGLQLTLCLELNEFILTLSSNQTRTQLSISKTVNPMYIISPPKSAKTVAVRISEETKATLILTNSYFRDEDDVILKVKGSNMRYSFTDKGGNYNPTYLKIVGDDDDIHIISMQIDFI